MIGLTRVFQVWNKYVGIHEYVITLFVVVLYVMTSIGFKFAINILEFPFLGFVSPVVAIPIPFALLLGLPVAVGTFVGYIAVSIMNSTVGVETLFVAISHSYLAFSAYKLRGQIGSISFDGIFAASPVKQARGFLIICVIASGGAAAIVAWGYEISSVAPFFQLSMASVITYLSINLTFGLFIFVFLLSLVRKTDRVRDAIAYTNSSHTAIFSTAVVTVLWLTLGFVGSVGYRAFEKLPRRALVPDFAFLLVLDQPGLFGPGATRIQALFGSIMFSFLILSYR